jgi:hypothetical protein
MDSRFHGNDGGRYPSTFFKYMTVAGVNLPLFFLCERRTLYLWQFQVVFDDAKCRNRRKWIPVFTGMTKALPQHLL